MVSSLIAGTVVPSWDRSLMEMVKDATLGIRETSPTIHLGVVNGQGQVYRRIVVHGPGERDALLRQFAQEGFNVKRRGDELVVDYSELATELKAQQ